MLLPVDCDHKPTLQEVADITGVPLSAIDAAYGVKLIDPHKGRYVVRTLVDVDGGHSDPEIGVFGRIS